MILDGLKIFFPNIINDQPIDSSAVDSENKTKDGTNVFEPNTILPTPISVPVVSKELICSSLNTQARTILGGYTFGQVGSISIGKYSSGVSGDIRISPDGIVGRNSAGSITFSIDGTTGNATFLGTVAAGSVIAANISANIITSGTLNADRIGSNSITAGKLSVSTLSSITANIGTITAGTITGCTITSSSGSNKIELNTGDYLNFYRSGTVKGRMRATTSLGSGIVCENGDFAINNNKAYYIAGKSAGDYFRLGVDTTGTYGDVIMVLTNSNKFYLKNSAEDTNLFTVSSSQVLVPPKIIFSDTRDSDPSENWCMYAYSSGGTYQLRVRLNGSTYSTDLSSV